MKTIFTLLVLGVLTGQLHAQVVFNLSSSPGVGNGPDSVAAADVNGDGKIDLISANYNGYSLTVLTNDGSGGFGLAGTYPVGIAPHSVAAADVNGDGKIDLISANAGGSSLTVFTNDGSGGFVLAGTYSVGSNPDAVAAADVNGDGKIDLITANQEGNSLTVLTNDGSGGFVLAGTYSAGSNPDAVAAADVNGDGKIDLISANQYVGSLTVLTNDGSGGFVLAGTYSVGNNPYAVNNPYSVAAADVNGDGKVDLISANVNGNSLTVLTNDSSGGFVLAGTYSVGSMPYSVAAADVNGDGKIDLISANSGANSLTILTNDGSGGFVLAGTYSVGSMPYSVAAADVNGDGKIDLISANDTGHSLTLLTNATSFPSSSLPILVFQPLGQTNVFGSAASFTVLANATGIERARQFSYQWRMAETNLPGATNNSLILTNLSFSHAGNYDVVVSNYVGSVTSSVAILDVQFILVSVNGRPAIGSGTSVASGQVTITGGYSGGFLFYTLDGSTPTTESTLYAGPFTVTNTTVVTVMAMSADFSRNTLAPGVTVQIIPVYNLGVSVNGSGTVGLNPVSGSYPSNSVVTLTATAATNWVFSQWTGDVTASENPYNLTMNGPLNVQAVFTPTACPLTASTAGGGSVTVNGQVIAPATYYPTNSTVSITATASNGWSFLGWQGDASGTNNPLDVTMNTTNNIRAIFATVVGTNAIGGGGIVLNLTNPVAYGTLLTASAVPDAGKYLVAWSSAASGTNSPTTIQIINATPTAGAVFATLPGGHYSLAVVVIGRGSVGISNQQSYYNPGSIVRLTASTTNAGTGFDGWSGNASGTNQTIVLAVNSNMVVQATFGKPLAVITLGNLIQTFDGTAKSVSATTIPTNLTVNLTYNGIVNAPTNVGSYTVVATIVDTNYQGSVTNTLVINPIIIGQVVFNLSSSPGVGSNPRSVAAADVNGDGKIDLISANDGGDSLTGWKGSLTVLTNNGSGGFVLAGTNSVGSNPYSVAAADVNEDGKIDLISANYSGNSLTVLTNNGSGGFGTAGTYSVGTASSVAAADVNGDGKIDLISAKDLGGSLTVFTNNGRGGFVAAGTYPVGNAPYSVATADVNEDGRIDLISANAGGSSLTVLTNNGSGGFGLAGSYSVGSAPFSVAVADVNGDGKIDLISANRGGNSLTVLTNNGSGGFGLAGTYSVGNIPYSVATADVNGDGKIDLISANSYDNSLTVLTNDGGGGFVLAGTNSVGSNPFSVAVADVNGDGKIDLISANQDGNSLTVLTNGTGFPSSSLPILVSQPLGQTKFFGGSAPFTISATATGIEPARKFSYQWRMTGTNLPGATNNSLILTNLSSSQAGNYDVVVSNYVGSVTSSVAILDVEFILVSLNGRPAIGSGTAIASGQVTISGGYPGGFLFYTLNGSTPTTASTLYTGLFTVTNTTVVNVMAMSADFSQNTLAPAVTVQIIPVYNLGVSVSGSGTVGLNPASGPYPSNSVVTLTATAATNWVFSQWTGDVTASENPYNLTMNGPLNVQAVFTPTAYPLTVSTAGGGSVTVNGQTIAPATYYPTNSAVSITATASNGWSFLNWQGDASGTNNPLNVTMNTTNNIRAIFGTVVGTNAIGGGGVMLNVTNPVAYGTLLTASAVPDAGKYLVTWSSAASGTNSPTTILVTNAIPTVGAVFATLPGGTYSLAVVVIGRGLVGISNQQSYYNPGSIVRLTASTTNAGTGFDGWSGDASGTSQTIVLTMNSNMVVQANFGKPLAVITLGKLSQTFDGTAKSVSVTTVPTNLTVNLTYDGSANTPTNAGSYTVVVTITDTNYIGGATNILIINPATPTITTLPTASAITYGQTLADSTLSGGMASTDGSFAFTTPTIAPNAGTTNVSVTFTPTDTNDYTTTNAKVLVVVNQALATVTLANLNQTYNGTAKPASVATSPLGLNVSVTYNGLSVAPTNAGNYVVTATVNSTNYIGSATNTLMVNKATGLLNLTNLVQTYNGTPKPVTANTTPTNLTVTLTYNNSANAPTNAGSYAVVGTINNPNYAGNATNTLTINPANSAITVAPTASAIIYGQTLADSTLSGGAATTDGSFAFTTPGIAPDAGITNVSVTFTPTDTNDYTTTNTKVLVVVNQALATVTLTNLTQTYNGTAKPVIVATLPIGLNVGLTYNGLPVAPTNAGSYIVVAMVNNTNYFGSATNTLVIGQAPAIVTISNLTQFYDGTPKPVTTGTIPKNLTVSITYNGSNGIPSAIGSYAVIADVNDANYYGSATNTLIIIPVPPFITKQPTNQNMVVGSSANFNVSASGTGPLSYQWQKNNEPLADNGFISGSTTSNLTLNVVSTNDAGSYSVVITNVAGSVTSSNANLVVNAEVYVAGTNVMSGGTVNVPIKLKALGQEISLQFSLSFNPSILNYLGVDNLGVIVTTNSPLPGQIGLTFQNFAGYSPGDQTLVNVVFAAQPVTSNTVSQINFADVPVGRQVIDGSFNVLSNVTYNGGSVTVVPAEYAADVYPRPAGDSTMDLRDWAEMGRFVTALDVVSNADEMLRADCAPRGNPDGVLTVADWVQAGRYAAKLDPLTVVSSGETPPQVKPLAGIHPLGSSLSLVQLVGSTATNGQTVSVPVNLVASGSENALGFNVAFDPTQLALQGIAKGSAAGSTVMNVNTNQAATGRLGVTLALNSGNVFASGTNQITKLSFKVLDQVSGNLGVAFAATNPVVEQVCDINAGVLNASYTSAIISVQSAPKPTLQIQLTAGMVNLSWPQAFSNYTLQSSETFATNTWNTYLGVPSVVGTNLMITQPATNRVQFYRLE